MRRRPRGFSLTIAILCISVLTMIALVLVSIATRERSFLRDDAERLQAVWLVEAGAERAAARLAADAGYAGEDWAVEPGVLDGTRGAIVSIAVAREGDECLVRVRAVYPAASQRPKQANKTVTINLNRLASPKEQP